MQIYPITQLLQENGFAEPNLYALIPDEQNYTALLFQPKGDIEYDSDGVRHADASRAEKQFASFIELAVSEQAHLAITPECSMPWRVIETALANGIAPPAQSLWVFGCESITLGQLESFRARIAPFATVLYEHIVQQGNRFVDPLLYVFTTTRTENPNDRATVIVVQLKTATMGDRDHYETNNLQLGNRLYCFGDGIRQIRLATIICSDAFVFTDADARDLYDRTLLIHIQLNPSPRQAQYRGYRDRFLAYKGNETELICLNWAQDVNNRTDGKCECWNNISGSTWYLRPDEFDISDRVLTQNHKMGLYYTWFDDLRSHALHFSCTPAVFRVTTTKVAHNGVVASRSYRTGPILTATRTWDSTASQWIVVPSMEDGFSEEVRNCGVACNDIVDLASDNPFYAERALALCAGEISNADWHTVKKLDSCQIDKSEIVHRITACHDKDPAATQFRTARINTAHRATTVLTNKLPVALADLEAGFKFDWSSESPHTNIVARGTARLRATLIYLGDRHGIESIEEVAVRAAKNIGQFEKDPNDIIQGRQRIAIWYRNSQGEDEQYQPDRYVKFDKSNTDSPVDFASER